MLARSLKPANRAAPRAAVRACAQPAKKAQNATKHVVAGAPLVKPVLTAAVANAVMAMPAEAAGKLFDFGLTLPIMAGQFLLLMVFLDKTWFTPVGKVLDERDELIRSKLASVQGDSNSIAEMQDEAERIVKEARAEANAAVNEAKSSTQAEQDAKLQTLKAQVDSELEKAMSELEKERAAAEQSVNDQVDALAEEILMRILPDESDAPKDAAAAPAS